MLRFSLPVRASALLALALGFAGPLAAQERLTTLDGERWERAREAIHRAKSAAPAIPAQARTLAGFAWPPPEQAVLEAQVLARHELIGFARHGIEALRDAVKQAAPLYQADVVAATIQAQRRITSGIAPDLFAALDDGLWFGSVEARRLAMRELARFGYRPAVLPIIDAARAQPELVPTAVRCLGRLGDTRAQHYLGEVLSGGHPRERRLAAEALARIGDVALEVLREATRSSDADIRGAAVLALLPRTGLDDLTVLHEYVGLHGDDDPAVVGPVRERARLLEELLEQQQLQDEGLGP